MPMVDDGSLLTHRDLYRDMKPQPRCDTTGKLILTTRLAHRAVRLMRKRGEPNAGHYRCPACLGRHLTSMPRALWPAAQPLNSPVQYVEGLEDVA